MLPIKHKTLVYGSEDGGETIFDSTNNPELEGLVNQIAKYFRFSPHPVADAKGVVHMLSFAADVEVHYHGKYIIKTYLDFFKQYFFLDFGRFLPPNNESNPFVFFLFFPTFSFTTLGKNSF